MKVYFMTSYNINYWPDESTSVGNVWEFFQLQVYCQDFFKDQYYYLGVVLARLTVFDRKRFKIPRPMSL